MSKNLRLKTFKDKPMNLKNTIGILFASLTILLVNACTTIPFDEREQIRDEVDETARATIEQLVAEDASIQASLDKASGYAVASLSATKIPIVGGGYGLALLYDQENNTRTYINVTRLDLGAGIGAGKFRVVLIFENREALERFRDGSWQSTVGVDTGVGSQNSIVTAGKDGYSVHYLTDTGVSLAASARLVKTSINEDLTDTGVSAVSFPNSGFDSSDEQGEAAPRIWDHKLPFLAQKVIDEGYDLPLPYGIGFIYANVDQLQVLEEMQVGINGSEVIPYEFVSFENARSVSNSYSLKADAWILPFMNVYAMVGKVDGYADINIDLDGNGMLEQLDVTCEGLPPSPLCPLLEDKTFTLPQIRANYDGTTYGVGATLAGGWKGWFVAVPLNWTYADISGSDTDGINFTVAPRFGKTLNLGRNGNLSLFAGGNYLDSDLTVDGLEETPDGLLSFDYIIEQENKDKWNLLVGFNWDINRRLSWSAEYNGFTGSREAIISSLNWRF